MNHAYTENTLVKENTGHLQERKLRREVAFAHSSEHLGKAVRLAAGVTVKFYSRGM